MFGFDPIFAADSDSGKASIFLPRRDRNDPAVCFPFSTDITGIHQRNFLQQPAKIWLVYLSAPKYKSSTHFGQCRLVFIWKQNLVNLVAGVVDFSDSRLEDQRPSPEGRMQVIRFAFHVQESKRNGARFKHFDIISTNHSVWTRSSSLLVP